jgi:hypothetical protein
LGFDHRIGHFRPLRIIGTTPNSSALNGLGASTWDRSRWGGRRHDQGPVPLFEWLNLLIHKNSIEGINKLNGQTGHMNNQREEKPGEIKLTAGSIFFLAFLELLNFLSNTADSGIQGEGK